MGAVRKQRKPMERALWWVGTITAVLSLFFGIYQLATMVSAARDRGRHIEEMLLIGKAQQGAGDYESAWTSFEDALKSAEQGGTLAKIAGQLDAKQARVRVAQEDLAMEWLGNIHAGSDEKFSDTVDRLLPALLRGAPDASGSRKADLLAHIGWSYFLKSRDDASETSPDKWYREALQVDSANPYAHAYWGHWILWRRGPLDDALMHFSAAVAANRELAFVRRKEISALMNSKSDTADVEFLRVVNEMSRNHEPIDARSRSDVYSGYYFAMNDDPEFKRFTAAVPASQQIELIHALFYDSTFDPGKIPLRNAAIAVLQEADGKPAEALATWQTVRAALKSDSGGTLRTRADAAIKRLSKPLSK